MIEPAAQNMDARSNIIVVPVLTGKEIECLISKILIMSQF